MRIIQATRGIIGRGIAAFAAFAAAMALALAPTAVASSLDPTFGDDGSVTLKRVRGVANAVDIGPRGRIIGFGTSGFAVVRLRHNGQLDRDFGNGGERTVHFRPGNDYAVAGDVRQHGRIVAAGTTCQKGGGGCEFGVVRLTRGGRLDKHFGHGGKVRIDFPGDHDVATAVAFAYRDILVAGKSCTGSGSSDCDIAVARLHRHGSLDRSFGDDGKVLTTFEASPPCAGCEHGSGARTMAIDSKGRIVVAGESASGDVGGGDVGIVRFKKSGRLDRSFGDGGKVRADARGFKGGAVSVAVDSRNRIDVAGNPVTPHKLGVARFTPQGQPDRSFGIHGFVARSSALRESSPAHSLAIDSKGRIVVAGGSPPPSGSSLDANAGARFVRFDRKGRIDRSFGKRGVVAYQHGFDLGDSRTLAIDSRDRVVVGGGKGDRSRFAFLRLRR